MDEKDKIIASLRKQLAEATSKNNGLEQEVCLLQYELEKATRTYFFDTKNYNTLRY
jgi:hypothetical protein